MMILSFLLLAWFLSWFNFEEIFCDAIDDLFNKHISTQTYYFFFFVIGLIGDIILFFRNLW